MSGESLSNTLQRKNVSFTLAELQFVMPSKLFVNASASEEQSPHMGVENVFAPVFETMLNGHINPTHSLAPAAKPSRPSVREWVGLMWPLSMVSKTGANT